MTHGARSAASPARTGERETAARPNTITQDGSPAVAALAALAWAPGGAVPAPSPIADQSAALRVAVGEVDALAAVTVALFDDGDWARVDPLVVDRLASLLGLVARGATAVVAAVERFHSVVADAQPAAGGDDWDDEGAASQVPRTLAYRAEIVRRLRARCAAAFDSLPTNPSSGAATARARRPTMRCSGSSKRGSEPPAWTTKPFWTGWSAVEPHAAGRTGRVVLSAQRVP